MRAVAPNLGAVARGRRSTIEVELENGRRLRLTRSTSVAAEEDAAAVAADLRRLGYDARLSRRHLAVDSTELHARLAAAPERWLPEAPAWARAHVLSALASAAMATPRTVAGGIANLALKQRDPGVARLAGEPLASLGFRWSLAPSRGVWIVRVLGGDAEKLRFIEEVGFCRAAEKRPPAEAGRARAQGVGRGAGQARARRLAGGATAAA